jgi:DNA-binding response OmpR family regulator
MPKILVIDDDPDVRMLMNVLMKKQGYEVETAYNKEDALVKLQNFHPSVILLDVLLSGTDGRELCKQLKQTKGKSDIPVLLYSAGNIAHNTVKDSLADEFIPKPFDIHQLANKINLHLQTKN